MAIKVNYDGLSSDITTLTTNVKSICDSLDTLNNTENIIPGSWTSPASEKYRSTVESDLVSRVADLEGSLTGLIKMLVSISDSFNNLEGVIGSDLKSWYDGLNNNGKVLDILSNGLPTSLYQTTNYDLTNLLNNPTTTSDPSAYDPTTLADPSVPTQPTPTGGGGGTPSGGGGGVPSSPSQPSTPSQPAAPSTPTTPSQPAAPSTPSTPSQPAAPSTPSAPSQPAAPSTPSTPSQSTTPSDGFNSSDYDFVDNSGNTAISFDDDVSVSSNISNSSTAGSSNDNLDLSFTDEEGKTTIHFD